MNTLNLDSLLNIPLNISVPEIKSIPEMFFEDLVAHIRELEHGLDKNERIAFVYNQTGEVITVQNITRRGMALSCGVTMETAQKRMSSPT